MQNLIITNKGQELIAKLIAKETTATFTKICTSDYDYSKTNLENVTEIQNIKQQSIISSITKSDKTLVEVTASVDNKDLDTGYYVRALGLYAKDTENNEILYGISIETENPDYLPAFANKTVSGISYKLNSRVDNSEQITVEINPAATPTIEQVQALQTAIDTHVKSSVSSEDGIHGIRFFNNSLEFYNKETSSWNKAGFAELATQGISLYTQSTETGELTGGGENGKFKATKSGVYKTLVVDGTEMNIKQGEDTEVELITNVWYNFIIDGDTINFSSGGGGFAGYNFDIVVGGENRPTSPKNNTFWIKTANKINKWIMQREKPTEHPDDTPLENNDLWIEYSLRPSEIKFNAVKNGGIDIMVSGIHQYIDNKWKQLPFEFFQKDNWIIGKIMPKIVVSDTTPQSPEPNTIWVKSNVTSNYQDFKTVDTAITNTRPDDTPLQQGDVIVYIKDMGAQNNAVVEQFGETIPLLTAKQYNSNSLSSVVASLWKDNKWVRLGCDIRNPTWTGGAPNVQVPSNGYYSSGNLSISSNSSSVSGTSYIQNIDMTYYDFSDVYASSSTSYSWETAGITSPESKANTSFNINIAGTTIVSSSSYGSYGYGTSASEYTSKGITAYNIKNLTGKQSVSLGGSGSGTGRGGTNYGNRCSVSITFSEWILY